jgi:DNA-binding NtrC family response regulator
LPLISESTSADRIKVLLTSSDPVYARRIRNRLESMGMEIGCLQPTSDEEEVEPEVCHADVLVVQTFGLGDQVCSFIERVREACPMVEIVAVSSAPLVESTVQALRDGVFSILPYPVSDDRLAEAIQGAYRRKQRGEQRMKQLNGSKR